MKKYDKSKSVMAEVCPNCKREFTSKSYLKSHLEYCEVKDKKNKTKESR